MKKQKNRKASEPGDNENELIIYGEQRHTNNLTSLF